MHAHPLGAKQSVGPGLAWSPGPLSPLSSQLWPRFPRLLAPGFPALGSSVETVGLGGGSLTSLVSSAVDELLGEHPVTMSLEVAKAGRGLGCVPPGRAEPSIRSPPAPVLGTCLTWGITCTWMLPSLPSTPWGWVTWGWVTSTPRLLGWVTQAHGQLSLSKMSRAPRLEGMEGKTLALRSGSEVLLGVPPFRAGGTEDLVREGRMARAGVPSFPLPHGIMEREGDTGVHPASGPEPRGRRLELCCVWPPSPSPALPS